MKDENVMYVKLENDEGVKAKSDILSIQMSLLKILRAMRGYSKTRAEELKIKSKLFNSIKETNANIKKIQENIPKLTTSPIKKPEEEHEFKSILKERRSEKQDTDLESQLRDIQEKLRALQR